MTVNKEREYRSMQMAVRSLEEQEDSYVIEGYATTFNQAYRLYEDDYLIVEEIIASNAFDGCDMSDVIMQYDHEGRVFARTRNNTLQLIIDEVGLKVVANLGGTEEGRKLYNDIKGGYIDRMSFSFLIESVSELKTDRDGKTVYTQTIEKISKLYDVSAVSIPANGGTSIYARNYINGVIDKDSLERKRTAEIEAYKVEVATLTVDEIEQRSMEMQDSEKLEILNARKEAIRKEAEKAKEMRKQVLEDTKTKQIEKPKENRTMELNKENYLASKEYRSAFLKTLQGKELNAEERSAYALADVEAVVPQELQNTIIEKAKEYAPILTHVELLSVNGVVKVAVEGVVAGAKEHEENAVIEADKDTLVEVELTTHEIVKLVQISASVKSMSMPAFEAWLVAKLAEAIAMKIENTIFTTILANGEQAGTEVSYASILALFSKLKSAYARNAKLYMSRETLYTKVIALQDKSKHDMVVLENGAYKLMGVEIHCTDTVANNIVLCDPKKFIANMAENIAVKSAYDINTNSYKYLGVAQFDGKVAFAEAFQIIKIAQ